MLTEIALHKIHIHMYFSHNGQQQNKIHITIINHFENIGIINILK